MRNTTSSLLNGLSIGAVVAVLATGAISKHFYDRKNEAEAKALVSDEAAKKAQENADMWHNSYDALAWNHWKLKANYSLTNSLEANGPNNYIRMQFHHDDGE